MLVKELPAEMQPVNRVHEGQAEFITTAELIAAVLQTPDALDQAVELVKTYRLQDLLNAEPLVLTRFKGIGKAAATRLQAALELGRRLVTETEQDSNSYQVTSPERLFNILNPLIGHKEREHFVVICMDRRNKVLKTEILYQGTVDTTVVRTAEIFKPAIVLNASAIAVGHNHPSGAVDPSPEDVNITRSIVDAGQLLAIDVLDHIIVGNNRYTSLRERGVGFEREKWSPSL